jgi:hypothetical protein
MAEVGPWEHTEGLDRWETRSGDVGLACSFCGSLHPDRFLQLVREGWVVGPTDKAYKAYLEAPEGDGSGKRAKFYFLHLSTQQQDEFVELHNSHQMQVGYPGHFYVPPYFTTRVLDPTHPSPGETS